MRVNIYNEELTNETKIVTVDVPSGPGLKVEWKTFYGLRVYLKSPADLHHTDTDDDRSAVTFWFGDHSTCQKLEEVFKAINV